MGLCCESKQTEGEYIPTQKTIKALQASLKIDPEVETRWPILTELKEEFNGADTKTTISIELL